MRSVSRSVIVATVATLVVHWNVCGVFLLLRPPDGEDGWLHQKELAWKEGRMFMSSGEPLLLDVTRSK